MPINETASILVNPDIIFRKEEEGAFLFDPETGQLKCLNPLGSAVWKLLEDPRSFKEIETLIVERYPGVSRIKIAQDVAEFLLELLDIGYAGYQLDEQGR